MIFFIFFLIHLDLTKIRREYLRTHPMVWEESSARLTLPARSSSRRREGELRTGAGRERFPLSHENCPRCTAVSESATESAPR